MIETLVGLYTAHAPFYDMAAIWSLLSPSRAWVEENVQNINFTHIDGEQN